MDAQSKPKQHKKPIGLLILLVVMMLIFAVLAGWAVWRIFFRG